MTTSVRMWRAALPLLAVLFLAAGCSSVRNNYLTPENFKVTLEQHGLKVDGVRELSPDPFRATSGCAFLIDGSEIGVYKYDRNSELQRKKLERIEKTGRTYITGIPYPAKVYGSFMIFGLEKNKHKRASLETLSHFR